MLKAICATCFAVAVICGAWFEINRQGDCALRECVRDVV